MPNARTAFLLACLVSCGAATQDMVRQKPVEASKHDEPCAAMGEGFVRLPGSSTCVRVGGRVRFDASETWSR
jgi:hypothetical protein